MTKIKKTIGKIPYSLGVRLTKPNDKTSEKRVYAYAQRDETIGTAAPALASLEDRLHLGKNKYYLLFRSVCTIFVPDYVKM